MKIQISELRQAAQLLFNHLEDDGHSTLSIPYDYYWNIPKTERYDISKDFDAQVVDLGQLSDDWESLSKILDGDSPPVAYGLVWLAEIIRVIGEEIVE